MACSQANDSGNQPTQIAFMADVHFHDVYGEFQGTSYKGVLNPVNGKYATIRTMEAQLSSTRLFNENYFAFLAALNDVVEKGVKYVALPGDFSDDGQPVNIRGLKKILDRYSKEHGITFIATTGNHDPVRPFTLPAGKKDFLGEGGKPQPIMSAEGLYNPDLKREHPVVVTPDICKLGYAEIIQQLGNYGFFPKKEDIYWETPFTNYGIEDYDFNEALKQSSLGKRNYPIPPYGTQMPDVSYLVEPQKGLWFLAIDANVYIPKAQVRGSPGNPSNYGSASIGYNNVLTHKKHLIKWVKKVTQQADSLGKTVIAFSHYPMVEFNDDASPHIRQLLGEGKMQLHRVPEESVAQIFADAGIKLHFGGHLHINDTGIRKTQKGNTLVNVQIPSLAAYIPAYKLLTIKEDGTMEVETIIIDAVPGFNELFPLYQQEHDCLKNSGAKKVWDKSILAAKNYKEYTSWHLKGLVNSRFLENDWPEDFKSFILNASGKDLLMFANGGNFSGIDANEFEQWTGYDMIFDFYRLRSADKLAFIDIGKKRVKQYQLIVESIMNAEGGSTIKSGQVKKDFAEFAAIFHHFMNGAPANHFVVDLKAGIVEEVAD